MSAHRSRGGFPSALVFAAAACWLLLFHGASRADPAPVSIALDGCVEHLSKEVRAIVALELQRPVEVVPPSAPSASPPLHTVNVTCEDDTELAFKLGTQTTQLSLGGVDERVRGRVVALTICELWERPVPPATKPAAMEQPTLLPKAAAKPALGRHRMVLASGLRRFGTSDTAIGAEATSVWQGLHWLAWLGLGLETGAAQRAPGSVDLTSAAIHLGVGRARRGRTLFATLGPGVTLGYLRARGTPLDEAVSSGSVSGLWFGPVLRGELGTQLGGGRWVLSLPLETGITAATLRGRTGTRDEELWRGWWVRAGVALGWQP